MNHVMDSFVKVAAPSLATAATPLRAAVKAIAPKATRAGTIAAKPGVSRAGTMAARPGAQAAQAAANSTMDVSTSMLRPATAAPHVSKHPVVAQGPTPQLGVLGRVGSAVMRGAQRVGLGTQATDVVNRLGQNRGVGGGVKALRTVGAGTLGAAGVAAAGAGSVALHSGAQQG